MCAQAGGLGRPSRQESDQTRDNERDPAQPALAAFNRLSGDSARDALLRCCESARWTGAIVAGRPYGSVADLLTRSDRSVANLAPADLSEALSGHPKIGDRSVVAGDGAGPGHDPTGWSRQEQAGVDAADEAMLQALAAGNAAYEQRFGHIYLACATGRSAAELLAFLRQRLDNDRETEWRVVAAELTTINQIRLRRLVAGSADLADSQ